jgi:hypothetical protein
MTKSCAIGDCDLDDHVMFNARGATIDGTIVKIRDSRNGRRFHVRPMSDVKYGVREWILNHRYPVLKL